MRARAVVFFFATWPCFIYTQSIQSAREISNSINNYANSLEPYIPCVEKLGLTKCASAYSVWKAEKALGVSNSSDKLEELFPWKKYVNTTDEELYSHLCHGTEKLLQRRPLVMNVGRYSVELGTTEDGIIRFDLIKEKETATERGSMKKLDKMVKKLFPLLVVPGLIMAAILPFFLPTLKMMTLAAGYLNQMALMGAVFTLLRNHAFGDQSHSTKIVYVNKGYLNDHYESHADTHSEVFAEPNFDTKFSNNMALDTHDLKDYNFFDNNGAGFQASGEFLKPAGHINMQNVKILDEINKFNWGKDFNKVNDFNVAGFGKKKDRVRQNH